MDHEIKEAYIQGLLYGYSLFAAMGMATGRVRFKLERIHWEDSLPISVTEYGRQCAAQDVLFSESYGAAPSMPAGSAAA